MTFSIVGRCARTGMLGVGIATNAFAVGARCPFVRPHVGAVATQATTDPRLGPAALDLLEGGRSAASALDLLVRGDPNFAHHQLGIVDRHGTSAAATGGANKDWAGHITGPEFSAQGNYLVGRVTLEAMVEAFTSDPALELDERLIRAIEAGRDAGGQRNGQRSAGILVHADESYPLVDLRVDAHAEPIGELRRVHALYGSVKAYYYDRVPRPEMPAPTE
jgi:uncharacterized Ntn-hydrolase superfamily protein